MSKKNKGKAKPSETTTPSTSSLSAPTSAPTGTAAGKWLLLILAFAALLRLLFLGRADLWQDEMLLVMTADIRKGMWEVLHQYWETQMVSLGWLPLPAMIQNLCMSFFSAWYPDVMQNPFLARLPGVALGVVGVFGVHRMTRNRYPGWIHHAATLIAAATFYPIFYAREVHAYPLLLALSPWVIHFFTRCLLEEGPRVRDFFYLAITTALLAYTHLTAPMFVFAMAVTTGLVGLTRMKHEGVPGGRRQAGWTLIAVGLAGALVIPVFAKILGGESPHLKEASSLSALFIVNDLVTKLFLGDVMLLALLAWVVFVAGVASILLSRKPTEYIHMILLALGGLLILAAAKRTQYLSARYFAVIAPLMMVVFAQGFYVISGRIARLIGKPDIQARIANVAFGAFLAVHLFLYLPPMYMLANKSTDYGSIASWLVRNLPEGTPYVMESAYELRYVSGFYPTPGLVAAVPFVHGSDPADVDRLWERQEAFLRRFPESVFVESAYHRNQNGDRWSFPDSYFRRHVELRDDSLRSLVRMGIYGTYFRKDLTDETFVTRIHYNTPDDLKSILLGQGIGHLVRYPEWQVAPLSQYVYVRAHPGSIAEIRLENLAGNDLRGRCELIVMPYTDAGNETVNASVRVGERRYGPFALRGGTFTTMTLEDVQVPAEGQRMVWRIESDSRDKVRALLAMDVFFTPEQTNAPMVWP